MYRHVLTTYKSHHLFSTYGDTLIQVMVFWVVRPCSIVVGYQHFGGPYCCHLQISHQRYTDFMLESGQGSLDLHVMKVCSFPPHILAKKMGFWIWMYLCPSNYLACITLLYSEWWRYRTL